MPIVTLLGEIGNTYTVAFGLKVFSFVAGVSQEVPPAVAFELQRKVGPGKKPLFQCEDMPEVVEPAPVEEQQNVRGFPVQLRFATWPLNA